MNCSACRSNHAIKNMELEKEEIIFKKSTLTVKLVRVNGQMTKIKIKGEANLTEKETVDLQYALNTLTGHL